jgi:hypothetical protein
LAPADAKDGSGFSIATVKHSLMVFGFHGRRPDNISKPMMPSE